MRGAIYLSVFLILTAVSFWFEDRVGIVPPVFNMLNFSRYPLTIYNVFIQFLLSWIIPFGFATFYPTTHFLGRTAFTLYFHLVPVVAAGIYRRWRLWFGTAGWQITAARERSGLRQCDSGVAYFRISERGKENPLSNSGSSNRSPALALRTSGSSLPAT